MRTFLHAAQAENAIGGVFPPAGRGAYLQPHRAKAAALSAGNARVFIHAHAQQGKTARRAQKHRHRADVLAKGAVVAQGKRQRNAHAVIEDVPGQERIPHDLRHSLRVEQKQSRHENQRCGKGDIAPPSGGAAPFAP